MRISINVALIAAALVVFNNSTSFAATTGQLGTTKHSQEVSNFSHFSYELGTVSGLSSAANARANKTLSASINATVTQARKNNDQSCSPRKNNCGYFRQSLKQHPCVGGYICITEKIEYLPARANDGQVWVNSFTLSQASGKSAPLKTFVPSKTDKQFMETVNAEVKTKLRAGGITNNTYWSTPIAMKDIKAWIPTPSGLEVWFPKFAVAPGSFGLVRISVPLSL